MQRRGRLLLALGLGGSHNHPRRVRRGVGDDNVSSDHFQATHFNEQLLAPPLFAVAGGDVPEEDLR